MKKIFYSIVASMIVMVPHTVFAQIVPPPGTGLPDYGATGFLTVIANVTRFVTGIIAVLAILMIVVSGIMYITSAGDSGRVETAKGWLVYSIVGLIVAILAFVIVTAVGIAVGAWS